LKCLVVVNLRGGLFFHKPTLVKSNVKFGKAIANQGSRKTSHSMTIHLNLQQMNEEEGDWKCYTQKRYIGEKRGEGIKMEPLSRCHRKEQDGYDSVCSYRSSLPDSPQTISPLVCTVKTTEIKEKKEQEQEEKNGWDYLPVLWQLLQCRCKK